MMNTIFIALDVSVLKNQVRNYVVMQDNQIKNLVSVAH